MHHLIYGKKILNNNQFAQAKKPTSFTLHHKVITRKQPGDHHDFSCIEEESIGGTKMYIPHAPH